MQATKINVKPRDQSAIKVHDSYSTPYSDPNCLKTDLEQDSLWYFEVAVLKKDISRALQLFFLKNVFAKVGIRDKSREALHSQTRSKQTPTHTLYGNI